MKHILILSDNIEVILNFIDILQTKNLPLNLFDFSCSDYQRSETFSHRLGFEVQHYNLKDLDLVERIVINYNVVISLHCQQVFPPKLVENVRCINVHPGYLPNNRGWYPHIFAIINSEIAGVTIHEISDNIDAGNIIARRRTEYTWADTSLELYSRILITEKQLLEENILSILDGSYTTTTPEYKGKLITKKDFELVKQIELDESGTYGNFINRLRALSHGEYKNAFFVDPISDKKIYVKISLEEGE